MLRKHPNLGEGRFWRVPRQEGCLAIGPRGNNAFLGIPQLKANPFGHSTAGTTADFWALQSNQVPRLEVASVLGYEEVMFEFPGRSDEKVMG